MRIGIICHDSVGGSARIAIELAVALGQTGHQVHLFAYSPPFGDRHIADKVNVHTVHAARPNSLHSSSLYTRWSASEREALIDCIIDVTLRKNLDILHFHYAVPFAELMAEVQTRLGSMAPHLVGTLHGTDVTAHHGLEAGARRRVRRGLQALDALTTVSKSHAKLAERVLQLQERPLVIPNFFDPSRFFSPALSRNGRNGASPKTDGPKIVHVSNFRAVKRVKDVAQIFAGVREKMDAELWLVGDGDAMESVKRYFRGNSLSNYVRYWGLQHDVGPILRRADLLLVASQYESFCLVALEAMACGVPVVATEVGGIPELITNGESGILYPVGECEIATERAAELLDDSSLYQDIVATGKRIASSYRRERIVPQYDSLYRQLLKEREFAWKVA